MRIQNILKLMAFRLACLFLFLFFMSSCEDILDNGYGDCSTQYQVKFINDYNMNYADAFPHEVKSVSLYAFDQSGKFVYQKTDAGEQLSYRNYIMNVDINPKDYNIVVWGGLKDNKSFSVPILTPNVSTINDLYCLMNRKKDTINIGKEYIDDALDPLFHAYIPIRTKSSRALGYDSTEVDLRKVNHNIHVVLQQMSGDTLNANDFDFFIQDANGKMNYKDSIISDDTITYRSWKKYTTAVSLTVDGVQIKDKNNTAIADISSGRLVTGNNPRLTIYNNKTNESILSIPIIDYALLFKSEAHGEMSDQDFLDRTYELNLLFFLDNHRKWMQAYIYINGWRINLNSVNI